MMEPSGIDKKAVYNILESLENRTPVQEREDNVKESGIDMIAINIAKSYYDILAQVTHGREPIPYSEIDFIDASSKELLLLSDEIDSRIILSQLAALHALIFSGLLDEIYIRNNKRSSNPSTKANELDAKTNIAFNFLETVRRKNQEEKMLDFPSGTVTVGFEAEYLNYIERMKSSRKIYEAAVEEFSHLINGTQSKVQKDVFKKYKQYFENELTIYRELLKITESGSTKHDLPWLSFHEWEPGVKAFAKLDLFEEKHTSKYDIEEVATRPSASYKTQIRDMIHASMVGGMRADWGIHETFGNIKLSKEHTEFMNGLPIAVAAGFYDFEEMSDEAAICALVLNKTTVGEESTKTRNIDMLGDYFPFHRDRLASEMEDINGSEVTEGVELRSTPVFGHRSFIKLVRQVNFHYLFAHTVKSVQKEDTEKVSQDHQLVLAYEQLMTDWTNLLKTWDKKLNLEWSLKLPDESEKCIQFHNRISVGGQNDIISNNGYLIFITKLIYLSQNAEGFKEDVRAMITKHNSRVKNILGIK